MTIYPDAQMASHQNHNGKSTGFPLFWQANLNRLHLLLLFLLGASLLLSNRWFTEVDDECAIIDGAARPIFQTIGLYLSGAGEHEHPPLYDLILHGWLQLTHGKQDLLRVPSVAFYLAGAWILAAAVERRSGRAARSYSLLAIVLWPFGFHFGRLATWYSLCFLLVAVVTWSYFEYLESPSFGNWCWLIVCSLLLLYSNYFAWALVGCLALDFIIGNRKKPVKTWAGLAGSGLLLMAAYLPVARAFLAEVSGVARPRGHIVNLVLNGIYDLYCLFVSESVAPWFWRFGVPVAAAIALCLLITITSAPPQPRRLLLYFLGLLAIMTVLGIANTKRMLFISPWLIFPIGSALAESTGKTRRQLLAAALLFIAAVGWFGIVSRNFYAAPHWVEPWDRVAQDAANVVRGGGIVVGNNPSFFFYLTYDLAPSGNESAGNFAGLLPGSTRRSGVYDEQQWIEAGRPLGPHTMLAAGMPDPDALREEAGRLGRQCVREESQRLVHDPGAEWKERFAPETGQVPWRIEISSYSCR
jgi:hypothetical protein